MPFMNNIKELCLVPGKASGDIASFEAASAPLVSCICTINPIQSGSGDPSPSNVRPITGHDDVTITQKDGNNTIVDTTTITFPDTVYGASLDVGTGVLTNTLGKVKLSDINLTVVTSNPPIFRGVLSSIPNIQVPPNNAVPTTAITERFGSYAYSPSSSSTIGKFAISDVGTNRIVFIDNSVNTLEAFLQKYGDDILVYPLATPQVIQLTPEQLNSILGDNNFYHDGNGIIDITYIRRIN